MQVGSPVSTIQRDPENEYRYSTRQVESSRGRRTRPLGGTLVEMYEQMRLARRFDERAVSLQRQGRMGTYPPLSGQEGHRSVAPTP